MENFSESSMQIKRRKYGPKKDFLTRLSVDSDTSSSSPGDKCNQSADSFGLSFNGNNQSSRNHSEKGFNQSINNFELGYDNSVKRQFSEGQKYSFNTDNPVSRNSNIDINQSVTKSSYLDNQSVRKQSGDEQHNFVNVNNHSQSVRRQSTDGQRKLATDEIDTYEKFKHLNNHAMKGQNASFRSQTVDCNEQGASVSSLVNRSFSTENESFDGPKKSRDRSSESISMMSLPDELRLSFSEIEEGSLQLDDLDLDYSPAEGGNTSSTTNACNYDQDKVVSRDNDLQKLAGVISSTSEQQAGDKQITEMSKVSEEFMTKDRQSANKGQNDTAVKTENNNSNNITWDDLVQWGVNAHQVSTVGSSGEVIKPKKTISPRRSSKNKHMENVACQVCGDMAAGFYCGAFICEACKKFYMRAYKQDKLKYVCLREKKCVITKESRVQCQYCRFQKCVSLNMFIPKQGEGEPNKDTHMSDIPCRVCSAPSSGFHFGAITCEGCKGFFRRMAKEREPEKYQCNKKGTCEINMVTRNLCKACRYRSCKLAGMSVEGSRIGRQPNSVKHAISMELKQGKPEGSTDILPKVKEEPIDESSIDYLTDNNKTDNFAYWNQKSDNPGKLTISNESSLCDDDFINTSNMVPNQSNISHTVHDPGTWPNTNINSNNRIQSSSPISPDIGSHMPMSNKAQMSLGNDMYRYSNQQSFNEKQVSKQEQFEFKNQTRMPPPLQKPAGGFNRSQSGAPPVSSLAFTPSPVTQFFSTVPCNENKPSFTTDQQSRETSVNLKVPAPINMDMNSVPPASQSTEYSPTQMENKQGDQIFGLGSFKTMSEFISKIIDAGKCLQLLNYRVFDTDVNPTTSMNVDDIKALFKSKYMDPKAGNLITSKVDMSLFSTRESTWNYMMTNFHHNTYITIRFAKLVPGFKTLSLNDQVKLIQSSIYPIELLNMSKVYDPSTRKYNYFTYTKEEENIMMEQFPMLRVFQEHFLHVGEMVTSFQFTDEEFALLSALLLFPAEVHGLENPKAVEQLQNQISGALQAYEERTFSDGLTRYGILLVRVAELVQCLLQHNLAIGLLLTHNPTIKVPQLFHELIIESIKEGQKL